MHGVGVATYFENAKNREGIFNACLFYSPRYNFVEIDNMSVSIGSPIGVGLAFVSFTNGTEKSSKTAVVFDLPLMLDLNLGGGAVKEKTESFGFFIGAGAAYHRGFFSGNTVNQIGNDFTTIYSFNSVGFAANIGIRYPIRFSEGSKIFSIRVSYWKGGAITDNASSIGLTASVTL
jgi:hypothetical protein